MLHVYLRRDKVKADNDIFCVLIADNDEEASLLLLQAIADQGADSGIAASTVSAMMRNIGGFLNFSNDLHLFARHFADCINLAIALEVNVFAKSFSDLGFGCARAGRRQRSKILAGRIILPGGVGPPFSTSWLRQEQQPWIATRTF